MMSGLSRPAKEFPQTSQRFCAAIARVFVELCGSAWLDTWVCP